MYLSVLLLDFSLADAGGIDRYMGSFLPANAIADITITIAIAAALMLDLRRWHGDGTMLKMSNKLEDAAAASEQLGY